MSASVRLRPHPSKRLRQLFALRPTNEADNVGGTGSPAAARHLRAQAQQSSSDSPFRSLVLIAATNPCRSSSVLDHLNGAADCPKELNGAGVAFIPPWHGAAPEGAVGGLVCRIWRSGPCAPVGRTHQERFSPRAMASLSRAFFAAQQKPRRVRRRTSNGRNFINAHPNAPKSARVSTPGPIVGRIHTCVPQTRPRARKQPKTSAEPKPIAIWMQFTPSSSG